MVGRIGNKGKKGQIIDLLYFIGLIFLIVTIGLIAFYVVGETRQQLESDNIMRSENIAMVQNFENRMPTMIDQLFMMALIGVGIVTLISAMLVLSHPIFYGIMMIVMAFLTWLSAIYANVFQEFASHPDWSIYADKFIMASFIMKYYPTTIIILSVIIVFVMVAKR